MKLCHITPLNALELSEFYNDIHFLLVHWAMESEKYLQFYRNSTKYKIIDSSMYELGAPLDQDTIIEFAKKMKVDEIIANDKLLDADYTIKETKKFLDKCPDNFKVMGVIQGKNINDWLKCFKFMNEDERIDVLGISKKGVTFPTDDFFINRINIISSIITSKPIHLLGVTRFEDLLYDHKVRSMDGKILSRLSNNNKKIDLHTKIDTDKLRWFMKYIKEVKDGAKDKRVTNINK